MLVCFVPGWTLAAISRSFVEIAAIAFSGLVKACTSKRGMDTSQLAVFEVYADSVSKLLLQHPSERMQAAGAHTCGTLITCQDSYVDHSKLTAYTPLLRHIIEDAGSGEDAAAALRAAFQALQSLLRLSDPPTLAKHAHETLPLLLTLTRKELHSAATTTSGAAKDENEEQTAPPSTLQLIDGSLRTIARGLNAAVGSSVYQTVFRWMDEHNVWEDHRFVAHVLRRLDRQSATFPAGSAAPSSSSGGGAAGAPTLSGDSWGAVLGASLPLLLLQHASHLAEAHRHPAGGHEGEAKPDSSKAQRRGTLLVTATPTGESGDGVKLLGMLFAARTLLQESSESLRVGDIASDVVDLSMPLLVASVAHDVDSQASLVTPAGASAALQSQRPMGSVHEEVTMLLLCLAQRLATAHELHRLATAVADWYGEFQEELLDMLQVTKEGQALVSQALHSGSVDALLRPGEVGGPLPLSSSRIITPARLHVLALLMSLLKQVVSLRWQHSDSSAISSEDVAAAAPLSAAEASLMAQVQLSNSFIPVPPQDVLVEVLLRDACDGSAAVRSMALQCIMVSLTSPLEWEGTFQGTTVLHSAVLHSDTVSPTVAGAPVPLLDAAEAAVLDTHAAAEAAVASGTKRQPHYPLVIRQMFSLPLTPLQLLRLHSSLLHSFAASSWRTGAVTAGSISHACLVTRICAAVLQRAGMQGVWFVWGLGSALVQIAVQLADTAQSSADVAQFLLVASVASALFHLVAAPSKVASSMHDAHEAHAAATAVDTDEVAPTALPGVLEAVPESASDDEGETSPQCAEQVASLDVAATLGQLLHDHGVQGALVLPCTAAQVKAASKCLLLPREVGCSALAASSAPSAVALQLSARCGGLLLSEAAGSSCSQLPSSCSTDAVQRWQASLAAAGSALLESAPFQHTARRVAEVPSRYVKRCFPALSSSSSAELKRGLEMATAASKGLFVAPGALMRTEGGGDTDEGAASQSAYLHGMYRLTQVLQPVSSTQRVLSCNAAAAAELAYPAVTQHAELYQHTTAAVVQTPSTVLEYMAHLLALPLPPLPVPPYDVEDDEDEDAGSTAGSEGTRSAAGASAGGGSATGAGAGAGSRPTSPSNSIATAAEGGIASQGSARVGGLLAPPLPPAAFGDAVALLGEESLPTPQDAVQRMQELAARLKDAQGAQQAAAEAQRRQLLQMGVSMPPSHPLQDVRVVVPPGGEQAGQLLPPPTSGQQGMWPLRPASLAASSPALRAAGHTESMPYLLPHGVAGAPKVML